MRIRRRPMLNPQQGIAQGHGHRAILAIVDSKFKAVRLDMADRGDG